MTADQIQLYARRYSGEDGDKKLSTLMVNAVKVGYMTLDDLIEVAKWKWRGARTQQLVRLNTPEEVKEITSTAFSAQNERLKIGALLSLSGVQWPMASVILHFAFPRLYPILDMRVMETVNGSTIYSFERWMEYTHLCRTKAAELNVTMRELDRALWAASKNGERS